MSDKKSHQRPWRTLVTTMAAAGVLGLAGCTDEDTLNSPDNFTKNSPADIAQTSADNYDNNTNGLITGSTLETWIDDWGANRPSGITGDLVILQIHPGMARYTQDTDGDGNVEETSDLTYISPNGAGGVRVYPVDHNDLRMDRSNGVLTTRSMVADGPTIDGFLQDHQIDPTEDMIVFAAGQGGGFQAMKLGRGWYTMRYWGVEKEHLAVLNGGAQAVMNATQYMGTSASDLPAQPGDFSVRELKQDNTALQVTLEEMIQEARNASGDVFIWDARNIEQYNATEDPFQNGGSAQGHPNGAVELNFSNLLVSDSSQQPRFLVGYQDAEGDCPGDTDANDESIYALTDDDETNDDDVVSTNAECYYPSYAWRSKSELETAMNGGTINGAQFQDMNGALGAGEAYQDGEEVWTYCETTYRAMVTGFATAGILGLPTRFYDGAMVEWHTMSNAYDSNGNQLLPADSPWRTDKDSISYFKYNEQSLTKPRQIDDPYADNTNAIIEADRAYKISGAGADDDSSSDDGGGAPVANPCGG